MSFYEKEGTFTNFSERVQRVIPALEPFGQSIPLTDLLERVALRLGLPLTGGTPEKVWNDVARSVPAYVGMTYGTVGDLGEQLPATPVAV